MHDSERAAPPSIKLQTYLLRLAAFVLIPLLLLAVALVILNLRDIDRSHEEGINRLAHNITLQIDRFLQLRIQSLQLLAETHGIDHPQLTVFYTEAQSYRRLFGQHVVLADAEGRMLFNTREPLGTPLPRLPEVKGHSAARTALATGKPAVGDQFVGPVSGEPMVATVVPVMRGDRVVRLLIAAIDLHDLQRAIDDLTLREGWNIVLRDGMGNTLARRGVDIQTPSARATTRITPAAWTIEVTSSSATLFQAENVVRNGLAIALLFGAIVLAGLLGSGVVARRVGRSLSTLADGPDAPEAAGVRFAEVEAVRQRLGELERQRQADAAILRESEETYRALFEHMHNGFALCRMLFEDGRPADFVYLKVNDAFVAQTGLRDVVGKRVSEVIPGIRESDPELFEIFGRVVRRGVPERFEIYLKALKQWFDVSAYRSQPEHFIAVFDIITERKQAEESLRASEARLRALTARLQSVREEERGRIARDLHDELGQSLTGLTLDVAWLGRRCAAAGDAELTRTVQRRLDAMAGQIGTMIVRVQEIVSELRPAALDSLGLVAALRVEADRFRARSGIDCTTDIPVDLPEPPAETRTALFRIVQECLTNVARHGEATRVNVGLAEADAGLALEVRDNGRGIAPERIDAPDSLGLLGMRERAVQIGGTFAIESVPGAGTTLRIRVPR